MHGSGMCVRACEQRARKGKKHETVPFYQKRFYILLYGVTFAKLIFVIIFTVQT